MIYDITVVVTLSLFYKGVAPTLRDLSSLPVSNWYLLGLKLGVRGNVLDTIERKYRRDNHMCKVKMFGTWLRVDISASYTKLARALFAVGKRDIAEAICTKRGTCMKVTVVESACRCYRACCEGFM